MTIRAAQLALWLAMKQADGSHVDQDADLWELLKVKPVVREYEAGLKSTKTASGKGSLARTCSQAEVLDEVVPTEPLISGGREATPAPHQHGTSSGAGEKSGGGK